MSIVTTTVVAFSLLLAVQSAAPAQTYSYQDVSYPGAIATSLNSINASGAIVGYYTSNSTGETDYVISPNGTATKVSIPRSASERFVALNDVGASLFQGTGGTLPYPGNSTLFVNKVGTNIDVGVGGNVAATSLNSANQVAGSVYGDGAFPPSSGFIYQAGSTTLVQYPGQTSTFLYGINDSGVTVGTYVPTGQGAQGFVYGTGTFSPIAYPGASSTTPASISRSGVVCGYHVDSVGTEHAFLATPVQ